MTTTNDEVKTETPEVSCETMEFDLLSLEESPDEILAAMRTQNWWLKFFVRPCCPPPGARQAKAKLDKLRQELSASSKFDQAQKDELRLIIDERENWYLHTPFCYKGKE